MGCQQSSTISPHHLPQQQILQNNQNNQHNNQHNTQTKIQDKPQTVEIKLQPNAQPHKELSPVKEVVGKQQQKIVEASKKIIEKQDNKQKSSATNITNITKELQEDNILVDPEQSQNCMKIKISNPPNTETLLDLGDLREPIYKVKAQFVKGKNQRIIKGESKQKNDQTKQDIPVIDNSDYLDNFLVVSLSDGNWCHTAGSYNCNNWWVQKGTISGIQCYKIFPPNSRPKQCLCSRHCIAFMLPEKKNYYIYKFQNQTISQVSQISSEEVKPKDWNLIKNVVVSDLNDATIFFVLPLDSKLPSQLALKNQTNKSKIPFVFKYQKILTGEFSKQSQKENPISPIIRKIDCFENFGIICLEDDYSHYCNINGEYNSNNWIVERYDLAGIETYCVNPPLNKAKKGYGSRHCISFFLNTKEDYNIFSIENNLLSQVSFISASEVKVNDWNMQRGLLISQISSKIFYFVYPSNKKLPSQLVSKPKMSSQGYIFDHYCQKMITGKFSKQSQNNQSKKLIIKSADCLGNFGVISLVDGGGNCHTSGSYNSNDWMVEKGTLIEVEAYRIQPPKSRPKECLASNHCIIFNLPQKKDYCIYQIQTEKLTQVSYIRAEDVKVNDWNIINNLVISSLTKTVIYFAYALDSKLPPELTIRRKNENSGKIQFLVKYQKLLTGQFSKQQENNNPISPIIKTADCFDKIGVVSVGDDYSGYCCWNGQYNYNDWIIEKGTLVGIDAYRIYPPLRKPQKGLGSRHCVAFFLDSKQDYNVFKVQKGKFQQISFINSQDIKVNAWNLQLDLLISQITSSIIYLLYPSNKKLPPQLAQKPKVYKNAFSFEPYCQKMLAGKFSKQFEKHQTKKTIIKAGDCLINFGIMTLSDGKYCQTGGSYNCNDWMVEKGTIAGIEGYRVHPCRSPPKQALCSRHCILFNLPQKKDYCFYKIQEGEISQVSHLPSQIVIPKDWNIIKNLLISQLANPVIFFAYPLSDKLPSSLPLKEFPTKLPFIKKYQKLLSGQLSRQSQRQNPSAPPIIRNSDILDNFGIVCLEDQYSRYVNTNGDHNYRNYIIEKGTLAGLEAYRVHPPLNKPKKGLGSRHCISFLVSEKAHYKIYRIKQNGKFTQVASILPEDIKIGQYYLAKNISVSTITEPLTFILLKQTPPNPSSLSILKQQYEPFSSEIFKKNFFSNEKNGKIPLAKLFTFIRENQKFLSGRFSKQKANNGLSSPLLLSPDCFENIGIMCITNISGDNHSSGEWNSNDWIIQKGNVVKTLAYRILPPEHPPTSTYATYQHCLLFKFPTKENYHISKIVQGFILPVLDINAAEITPNSYYMQKRIKISELSSPLTLIVQKSSEKLSSYTKINNLEAGVVYQDSKISIKNYRIDLPYNPHTPYMFDHGPATWQCCYPINRRFFVFYAENKEYTVWSNSDDTAITLTQFDLKKIEVKNIRLSCKNGFILGSAIGNDKYVYYTIVQPGKAGNQHWTKQMYIIKADINNAQIVKEARLATDKYNLNIHQFSNAHMAISGNNLALFISRTMTQAQDKLNHQAGYIAVINTESLEMGLQKTTSSHSFGNSLIVRKDGRFCGIDQGDVGPRGINYFVFDTKKYQNKVVYTYKTYHGTKETNPAGNPYPLFEEISTDEKKFYKWSNDNATYAEIAAPGIHEAEDGFYIFFTSENLPNPLDSTKLNGQHLCGTRNIGYIKTRKQLCQNLSDYILTKGPTYRSQFYEFSGYLMKQQVTGVQWLTDLQDEQNVSRLRTCMLGRKMLLLYQIWNKKCCLRTEYMILDLESGKVTKPAILPLMMRFYRSDDIFLNKFDGVESAVIMCGDEMNTLNRFEICLL